MAFEFPVRVYYEDTDAGGVAYHSNYLNFYERARTEFLRAQGFEQDELLEEHIAFVVKRCEIDYHIAARFNDQLNVSVEIQQLKKASIVFKQQIICAKGDKISTAIVLVACVDIKRMKPIAIPTKITEELSRAS